MQKYSGRRSSGGTQTRKFCAAQDRGLITAPLIYRSLSGGPAQQHQLPSQSPSLPSLSPCNSLSQVPEVTLCNSTFCSFLHLQDQASLANSQVSGLQQYKRTHCPSEALTGGRQSFPHPSPTIGISRDIRISCHSSGYAIKRKTSFTEPPRRPWMRTTQRHCYNISSVPQAHKDPGRPPQVCFLL